MCATDVNVQILGKFDHCVSYSWIKEVACCSLSAACGGDDRGGLNVVIADDDLVRDLNNQYRGLNENTDVLAFSFTNSGKYYGEGPKETTRHNREKSSRHSRKIDGFKPEDNSFLLF